MHSLAEGLDPSCISGVHVQGMGFMLLLVIVGPAISFFF
jgi:hypothetical protein